MKRFLVNLWNKSVDCYLKAKDVFHAISDFCYRHCHQAPEVVSIEETLSYIMEHHCSVSRLGDGEIKLVAGKNLGFQKATKEIQQRMIDVLAHPIPNHIVCLPDIFRDLNQYEPGASRHWRKHLSYYRKYWYRYTDKNRKFYNAFISRCYMMFQDKSNVQKHFLHLKQLWDKKNIIIVEGEKSRLGIGNDLFDNASSIKRILGPNTEAFHYYDKIIQAVNQFPKSTLILLALGPTATIMAYDLARQGYQAIDLGHVDIEYEWFRMGATHKVPVKNKFVNEAGAGVGVGELNDQRYLSEIVWHY
ncbi:SP_1767 family glycosyltransferase [uncultured Bacteroides sp.]|uniref:SP_1767 family glycosyltransferase n=1 Tax=uncultured Bacteroides sp. TaxID=162156 RepID=UPI0026215FB4|nr:SP_1767 family glycosyltransferase [uncultured Bacteroides sp.]